MNQRKSEIVIAALLLASGGLGATARADEAYAVHGQVTVVEQGVAAFRSPYSGPNSLEAAANGRETADVTLYLGVRPWNGAELWLNPEVDQGFGLSDTLGVAGFPSGEAYKVGKATPYLKLPRLFLRQTIDLGGASDAADADINQLAQGRSADRLVITLGKFSVADVFDGNDFAHDPRHDFLNWSLIDAGTFDYAADAWGFTYGAVAEWYAGRWTLRAGVFALSNVPNSPTLESNFSENQTLLEGEERHRLWGRGGMLVVTGFSSRGRMASFADALREGALADAAPDVSKVRRYRDRLGVSVDLQQAVTDEVGLFARAGAADGRVESYEFSDIDRTVSGGLSIKGALWKRADDVFGLAGALNAISRLHQQYLAAGGLGILVGDGKLPHAGEEAILETYYSAAVAGPVRLSADYQYIENPAYNRDRGPVSVFAARLHAQF